VGDLKHFADYLIITYVELTLINNQEVITEKNKNTLLKYLTIYNIYL